MGIVKCENL